MRLSIVDGDLTVDHERKLHLFVFDAGLKEFRHLHPEFRGNVWATDVSLAVNGTYWVWAQGIIASDGEEFTGGESFTLKNGSTANPAPPVLGDVRKGLDDHSIATLSGQKIKAGKMIMLDLTFSRDDGQKPVITPYLGANAHVAAVTSDADSLIHVHPMDTANPAKLMLHATFPEKGEYRLWIQFVDRGDLKTVPMSVTVY